jgi:hypothetical protein
MSLGLEIMLCFLFKQNDKLIAVVQSSNIVVGNDSYRCDSVNQAVDDILNRVIEEHGSAVYEALLDEAVRRRAEVVGLENKLEKALMQTGTIIHTSEIFKKPRYLRQEIDVDEYGKEFRYVGEAYGFVFNQNVLGGAKISKYELREKLERKFRLRSFGFVNGAYQKVTGHCTWSIKTAHRKVSFVRAPVGVAFITHYDLEDEVKPNLILQAKNEGIILSKDLLSGLFDPLQWELLQMYNQRKL